MDRKLLHQQIDSFLETLQEQHAHIREQERVYPIELDIMLSEVRKLYDCCRLLSKPVQEPGIREKDTAPEKAPSSPVQPRPAEDVQKTIDPGPVQHKEATPVPSIFFDTKPTPVDEAAPTTIKNEFREPNLHLIPPSDELDGPIISSTQLEIPITGESKTFAPFSHSDTEERKPLSLADTFKEEPSLYDKISKAGKTTAW